MSFELVYGWLVAIFGRILAQIICCIVMWTMIGGVVRLYSWLNGSISGGIDPVYFGICAMLSWVGFYIWRFFAENDLDG